MTEVEKLKEKRRKIDAKIKAIQDVCPHPAEHLTKVHDSDTGNWCKADDCYWTDFHCSLCDKRWTLEGSH